MHTHMEASQTRIGEGGAPSSVDAGPEAAGAADRPAPPRDPLAVGPLMRISTAGTLLAPLAACAAIYFAARLIVGQVTPGAIGQLWWGPAGAYAAFVPAILVMRPWKERRLGKWPFAWLGHIVGCFFLTVLAAGALLYFAAPEARAPLGLTLAAAHFAALLAEARVLIRAMRPFRVVGPAGGASSTEPPSSVRKEA